MTEPFFYEPDPEVPGWHRWGPRDVAIFTGIYGPIHVRAVADDQAEVRFDPADRQLGNVMGALHGGALTGMLDIALFGGSAALDACHVETSVTVELNTHFLSAGRMNGVVIVEFEVMRSTRRLLFARGVARQGSDVLLQYSAIIRKGTSAA